MDIENNLYKKYTENKSMFKNYKETIKKFLKKEYIYILFNGEKGQDINPMIFPIKDTDWLTIQVFETNEIAELYMNENIQSEEFKFHIEKMELNVFLLFLEKLYFNGITGILYNGIFVDELRMIYLPAFYLYQNKQQMFINPKSDKIIQILKDVFINKKYFYYLFHPTLTIDEILFGIVHFSTRKEKGQTYIDLFIDRTVAENYCQIKNIKINKKEFSEKESINKDINKEVLAEIESDETKEDYPITSIMNEVLFHSINCLVQKKEVQFANIHTSNKVYKIKIEILLQLIINTGFEQLDLR